MYYLFLGYGLTLFLPLIFVVIVGISIPIAHLQKNHLPLVYAQLICITWVSASIQWSLGSIHDSSVVLAWSFLGPVGALLFLKRKQAVIWMLLFLIIVLISVFVEPKWSDDAENLTQTGRNVFYLMNLCAPAIVVFFTALYFVTDLINQKNIIKEKHREISDSINYAERIQRSFMATKEMLDENLKDYFIFFKPKATVSGDFYWASKLNNGNFALVTADSTGHGVPGAIMSLLNITSLEKSIETNIQPAEILNETRKIIIERLKHDGSTEGGKDGMDASLTVYDFKYMKLILAAANNPVWIVRQSQVIDIRPDKMPVGKHVHQDISFKQHEIDLQKGDVIYTLTDGYADQFGGDSGKKYKAKNLRELLIANSHLPMQSQKDLLDNTFKSWMGNLEQIDDVCIIGIRV